ncbi:hypothetical protein [Microseira sp. BLCC-F43]|uniref:hypothetical protein n=1 Tax=Microseira sp. BLCC-F43 TaxID=3153602 RepID=UPI0035BA058C
MSIREAVQQALTKGYLTKETEKRLHLLLQTNDEMEDFNAFIKLQLALVTGHVRPVSGRKF